MDRHGDRLVTKRVSGAAFSFLSGAEVRSLSVKQITNALTFDLLKQPIPNGLYDVALGPVDKFVTYVALNARARDRVVFLTWVRRL